MLRLCNTALELTEDADTQRDRLAHDFLTDG
jgi:hypothetical protein